jgi:hypothetical protein
MRVIGSIEDPSVIRAILEHLGLWLARASPPPKIHGPPVCILGTGRSAAPSIADDVPQISVHDDHVYGDPQYSWNRSSFDTRDNPLSGGIRWLDVSNGEGDIDLSYSDWVVNTGIENSMLIKK